MKEVNVIVFGSIVPTSPGSCSCSGGCGPANMREDAEDLKKYLVKKFGEAIKFIYVDVQSDEMKNYPDIMAILDKVRLPLAVLNGEPRFHGGLSFTMIADAVGKLVEQ